MYWSQVNSNQTCFYYERQQTWNHKGRFLEAVCPVWTSWPVGDRILIWDSVWARWNSTAILPPTPTHSSSIKRSDRGSKAVCGRGMQKERREERLCAYSMCDCVTRRQKVFVCVHASTYMPARQCVCMPPRQGDSCWQPQVWRFVTQSCSNRQSWAGSKAKWTAFKAEISHHISLFEHTAMVLLLLHREMSNINSKSAKLVYPFEASTTYWAK